MEDDLMLLPLIAEAARTAGAALQVDFATTTRLSDRAEIIGAAGQNEITSLDVLRPALARLRPSAKWVGDEEESSALPPGEWWAVDAVEGNVNHVHGLPDWCVSVTLLRDNVPTVSVVHQPIGDLTYAAARGHGATANGAPLRVSRKHDLASAIVTTGQAEAGQKHTYRRIGDSIAAMLARALLVRVDVPSTFPLLLTAAGQNDVFWQYDPTLSGIAAGVLIATEAGAIATSLAGEPWAPGHRNVLVAAAGLHAEALTVLSAIDHHTDNTLNQER